MAEASGEKTLNLLLLGKTGNGKSMTGNTILQKEVFIEQAGGSSVTQDCELGGNKVYGRQVYVLDTPGSMDTEDPNNALKILATAIFKLQNCIDAFVIVMNYNLRMTNEERTCLTKLEELFGPQIFDFVVFVFTHADVYEKYKKRKKETRSLEDYVRENGGKYFQEVLSKCQNRCTGVDNTAEEDDIECESLKILSAIDEMIDHNKGKRYQSPYLKNENIYRRADITASLPTSLEDAARRKRKALEHFDTHGPEYYDDVEAIVMEGREPLQAEPEKEGMKHEELEHFDTHGPEYYDDEEEVEEIEERVVETEHMIEPSSDQISNHDQFEEEGIEKVNIELQKSGAECFPANALVKVSGRGDVKLKDLAVGDKVITLDNNMKVQQTEVYIFGHALEKCEATFINIQTKRCKLQATPGHLIYMYTEDGQSTKAARAIRLGDVLVTVDREGRRVLEKVREVWESEEEGLFAPVTLSGSMVVEGVLVSCYVDVLPDSLAHLLLGPVRMMYRCYPAALTTVSKVGQDGIPVWMRWWLDHVL